MKIIGITIAVILGILLFAILLILLVPLRYKVNAEQKLETKAKGRISWLFGIIYVKIEYLNKKMTYVVRVFGYPIISSNPKRKRRKRKKRVRNQKKQNKTVQTTNAEKAEEISIPCKQASDQKEEPRGNDLSVIEPKRDGIPSQEKKEPGTETANQEKESSSNSKGFFKKLTNPGEWIRSIKQKIRDMLTMIKSMVKRAGLVKSFLMDKKNKPGFTTLFGALRKVFNHISPRKYKVSLYFGFDDPAMTGQVLGAICAIYPQILGKVDLKPEFERKVLEGTLYARGRVRILTLLIWCIQLILKKEFKYVIKEVKQLKEEL
ncbi:MAG: DUF2953 domain-containing protein [bacterium]|nr:DUF2953 domain-containing protein [bacterium]